MIMPPILYLERWSEDTQFMCLHTSRSITFKPNWENTAGLILEKWRAHRMLRNTTHGIRLYRNLQLVDEGKKQQCRFMVT